MSEERRSNYLLIIGIFFGVATGFLATYDSLGSFFSGEEASTLQLLIESGFWTLWVGLQGLGFVLLYLRNKQTIFIGTGAVGFLCMVLEIIAIYQISNMIEDIAFSLIGVVTAVLYIVLVGFSITLLRTDDSFGKPTGSIFIVTGVVLMIFPPAGFALLGLSNLLGIVCFAASSTTTQTQQAQGLSFE